MTEFCKDPSAPIVRECPACIDAALERMRLYYSRAKEFQGFLKMTYAALLDLVNYMERQADLTEQEEGDPLWEAILRSRKAKASVAGIDRRKFEG